MELFDFYLLSFESIIGKLYIRTFGNVKFLDVLDCTVQVPVTLLHMVFVGGTNHTSTDLEIGQERRQFRSPDQIYVK